MCIFTYTFKKIILIPSLLTLDHGFTCIYIIHTLKCPRTRDEFSCFNSNKAVILYWSILDHGFTSTHTSFILEKCPTRRDEFLCFNSYYAFLLKQTLILYWPTLDHGFIISHLHTPYILENAQEHGRVFMFQLEPCIPIISKKLILYWSTIDHGFTSIWYIIYTFLKMPQ